MTRTFYDNLGLNENIELDLSMLEATGVYLHDESKNHHIATQHATLGTPLWMQLASGRYGISINPAYPTVDTKQFYDIPAADCLNLDFTSGDYSLALWFYWTSTGSSQILMSKYALDASGWEVYLYDTGINRYLTVRHHHGGTRTASYSNGWAFGEWHLWSYTRIGGMAYHYKDGELIATFISSGGLIDPVSSIADDWRFGCRYTEDQNWARVRFYRPRAWSKALTADEHRLLYRLGYP